jgi:ribonuclease P protein component
VTPAVPRTQTGGLPKQRRIRSRSDYQRIQEQGSRLQTRHFVIILANRPPGTDLAPSARLGMVVSRKVGNAVVRNRVKRLIREAFRAAGALFGGGLDVVVIARSTRADCKLNDVIAEWSGAEERIKRLSARLALARGA